jgi:iron complex outermembrane receptor protein
LCLRTALAALILSHCLAAHADLAAHYAFSIRPQRLSSALIEFSKQADVQVVGNTNVVADLDTAGVTGTYTARDALRLLLGTTPLKFEEVTNRSVRILPQSNAEAGT